MKTVINIFKYIAVAFSLYSKIPMPRFVWKESDMKNSLIFFPWVGIVIGVLTVVLWKIVLFLQLPGIADLLILGLIPLIITGGFHVDGYMDVQDALKSYADKEKKLEILKDPHIGAFAVIRLLIMLMFYGACLSILVYRGKRDAIILYAFIFVLSRCMSAITSLCFKKAKKEGMLYEETNVNGHFVLVILIMQFLITVAMMLFINVKVTGLILSGLFISLLLYHRMTYKEFGGVTGDTAGYLLVNSECYMIAMIAIAILLPGVI